MKSKNIVCFVKIAAPLLFAILTFFSIESFADGGRASSHRSRQKILMISSLNLETDWGKFLYDGFTSVLPSEQYFIDYVGIGNWDNPDTVSPEKSLSIILNKIAQTKYDMIVVFDPLAMEMLSPHADKLKDCKVLLAGSVGGVPKEFENLPNVYISRLYIAVEENIRLGLEFFPETVNIVSFSDAGEDGFLGHEVIKEEISRMLADKNIVEECKLDGVKFTLMNGRDFSSDEALSKLKELCKEPTFVLFYGWNSTKDKKSATLEEAAEAISEIADKKVIAFFDDTPNNVIGGYMTSGVRYATFVGQKARDILKDMEVDFSGIKQVPMLSINWNLYTEKQLDMDMVEVKAFFYYTQKSLWEIIDYRYVSGVMFVIVLLGAALLIVSHRSSMISRRNSVLFQNIPSNIYVFYRDGKICYNYSSNPSESKMSSMLQLGEDFTAEYKKCIDSITDENSASIEYGYDGRKYKATMAKVPRDVFGENAYIATTVDITELVRAMQAAQESDRAKSYFLATMSHELRTPLNAVIGYSELMQDPNLDYNERMHNLKNINFAGKTLLNLINDVLDLSRLEAGQMEIHLSPISMESVALEFANIFKFAAKTKGIYIKVDLQEGIPPLMMDMLRLRQVLMNIIGNAVKFTKTGGIDIKISYESSGEKTGDMQIEVKDTGIGIAPENLKKIFNPFEQDSTQRIRGRAGSEGAGLGLSIVKRLLENMNGTISVDSKKGEGSTFALKFKNLVVSDVPAPRSEEEKEPEITVSVGDYETDITVLIIDDVLMNIKVLRNMLKKMGVNVIETLDPEQVDEILKTHTPDIIMTDLWMPKMSGEELAVSLKANPETAKIPVLAITADTQLQNTHGVFTDILHKPITMAGIFKVIDKIYPEKTKKKA